MTKLKPIHKILIDNYFECGFSQVEAVRRTGYKGNPNNWTGMLFARPEIKAEIKRRMDKIEAKHDLTIDKLLEKLTRQVEAPLILAKYVYVTEDGKLDYNFTGAPPEDIALLAGFVSDVYLEGRGEGAKKVKKFKVDMLNPYEAMDRIAKLKGWYIDKKELTGPNGGPVEIKVDDKELARRVAFLLTSGTKDKE